MKILVTGGSGFIGKYLVNYFSTIHEVTSPSSKELNLLSIKSVDKFFKDKMFDIVIHCATVGRDDVYAINGRISSDIKNMYDNLIKHKNKFTKFINLGSGAEFGLDRSLDNKSEDSLGDWCPSSSYGKGKLIVSELLRLIPNCYTVRIFACLDPSEDENRLIKKFKSAIDKNEAFVISNDRFVDFIALADLTMIINGIVEGTIIDRDINAVYQQKFKVSDILYKYCNLNNVDPALINVTGVDVKNYTGLGDKLAKYNLPFIGLDDTLREYR